MLDRIRNALANAVAMCNGLLLDDRLPVDQQPSVDYVRKQCEEIVRELDSASDN
jgi:hypothetical protein